MTAGTPPRRGAPHDERSCPNPRNQEGARSAGRILLIGICAATAGVVLASATARAHGFGHAGLGRDDATASLLVVLGLPVFAGLVGGIVAVRWCDRTPSESPDRRSGGAVGLLLVGLGAASLLASGVGQPRLAAAGAIVGATGTLGVENRRIASRGGCGNHADLTLGAIGTHRLLEGVVLGTLYSAGAAVGLLGAVVLAGHAALETAAVGGLAAGTRRRSWVVGTLVLVQVSYLVGAGAGLGVAATVPGPTRTLVLAVAGGVLLVVGAGETERSIAAGRPARF